MQKDHTHMYIRTSEIIRTLKLKNCYNLAIMYKYRDSNLRPTIWVQCWKLRQWRSISKTPWDFVAGFRWQNRSLVIQVPMSCWGTLFESCLQKVWPAQQYQLQNKTQQNNMMFPTKERQLTRQQSILQNCFKGIGPFVICDVFGDLMIDSPPQKKHVQVGPRFSTIRFHRFNETKQNKDLQRYKQLTIGHESPWNPYAFHT